MMAAFAAWAVAAAASAGGATLPDEYAPEDYEAALAAARQSGKPILVYFTQDSCGYCRKLARLLGDDSVRGAFSAGYHLVLIDIEKNRRSEAFQQAMMNRFKVPMAPTLVFLGSGGNHLCTSYGGFTSATDGLGLHRYVQARLETSPHLNSPPRHQCGRA